MITGCVLVNVDPLVFNYNNFGAQVIRGLNQEPPAWKATDLRFGLTC